MSTNASSPEKQTHWCRYLRYRESGVEWIGEVPEHWKVRLLHRVLLRAIKKNRDVLDRKMLSLSAKKGVVFKEYEHEAQIRPKEENLEYLVVAPNQLIVNPMWIIESGIGVSFLNGIVSPAYRVYDINEIVIPFYLHYLVKTPLYISQYLRYIRGLTTYDRSVREDDFYSIEIVIPPLPEQTVIAAFLDRETARIDALIAKKERQIELLQEKRAALISHAVTKGLDLNAKMKDSGVESIGGVPEHWNIKKIRNVCKIRQGQIDPKDESYNQWILISPDHVESGTGRILKLETAQEQEAISGKL
jgi:type I restriction enzyme S subunit